MVGSLPFNIQSTFQVNLQGFPLSVSLITVNDEAPSNSFINLLEHFRGMRLAEKPASKHLTVPL